MNSRERLKSKHYTPVFGSLHRLSRPITPRENMGSLQSCHQGLAHVSIDCCRSSTDRATSCASSWSHKGSRERSLAATAQGDPIKREARPGRHPCHSIHLSHWVRSCFIKKANSGVLRISQKEKKRALSKKIAIKTRSTAEPALEVFVFFALLSKNHSKPHQKGWLSTTICLFLSGENRAMNIKTVLSPRTLSQLQRWWWWYG